MFRRKKVPDAQWGVSFRGFQETLYEVELAKEAMTSSVPSTRFPGTPLAEAIAEFEDDLGRAQDLMPRWRLPANEKEWVACEAGIAQSLERSRRLREDPPEIAGFEGLIWVVDQVLAPLEAFEAAAERFRTLRR